MANKIIILIIESNLATCELLRIVLESNDYHVIIAYTGEEALIQIQKIKPHLVLQDLLLPDIDSIDLNQHLREQIGHDIPIIAISGFLNQMDENYVMNSGFTGSLIKPIEPSRLLSIIKSHLKVIKSGKKVDIHKTVRQIEKEALKDSGLIKNNALQAAQLILFRNIVNTLTEEKEQETTVKQNILEMILDAAGVSQGVLYLKENNQITLHQVIGYDEVKHDLSNFFKHKELLLQALKSETALYIPSAAIAKANSDDLLMRSEASNGVIIPLMFGKSCLGILFLASKTVNFLNKNFLDFIDSLGKQIAQTIALTQCFNKLAISEQHYRLLMDKASCGLLISTISGEIIEANQAAEKILGHTKEQIIGKQFKDFLVPADRKYMDVLINELQQMQEFYQYEGRIQQAPNTIRNIEYVIAYVQIGKERYLQTIINDTTEAKRLRARSLLSDKLATIGTLATGILHEINNPMTWISENLEETKSNLQNLLTELNSLSETMHEEKVSGKKMAELMSFINKIQQECRQLTNINSESLQGAERVKDIVRSLKSYARLDDEAVTLTNIHDVINSAIKIAFHEFKHYAKLERDFSPNMVNTLIQRGKLQQVILNLVVNAAQALSDDNPEKNRITIKTSTEGNRIRIDVIDTGSGISEENLKHIFEPFFTTKAVGIGTGLGLPVCQEILNNFGGELTVKSKEGEGSTFSVFIPIRLEEPELHPKYRDMLTQKMHGHILIVDDEPSLLKTMQRILEHHHKVTVAQSGHAAIELISQDPDRFDVIISDFNMPDINGQALYSYLLEKYPGLEQRIIFVTGGMDNAPFQQFIAAVKSPCLQKPFTKEQLLYMVNNVMSVLLPP